MKITFEQTVYVKDMALLSQPRRWQWTVPRHLYTEGVEGQSAQYALVTLWRLAPFAPWHRLFVNLVVCRIGIWRKLSQKKLINNKRFMEHLIGNLPGMKKIRERLQVGAELEKTNGKRHAWFDSPVGRVRKPIK